MSMIGELIKELRLYANVGLYAREMEAQELLKKPPTQQKNYPQKSHSRIWRSQANIITVGGYQLKKDYQKFGKMYLYGMNISDTAIIIVCFKHTAQDFGAVKTGAVMYREQKQDVSRGDHYQQLMSQRRIKND